MRTTEDGRPDLAAPTGPVDLVLDPAALGDLVGAPVVAQRVRHKAGVSTLASYGPVGRAPSGWVQVLAPGAGDKAVNAARRAGTRAIPVDVHDLGRGWTAVCGGIAGDARLHRALDQLPEDVRLALSAGAGQDRQTEVTVLRYNPQRRLVLRQGDRVLRLSSGPQRPTVEAARALARAGVGTVEPMAGVDVRPGRRVSVWPWVPGGDLLSAPDPAAARRAGAMVARWHGLGPERLRTGLAVSHPDDQLGAVAREVAVLLPELGPGLGRCLDALRPRLRAASSGPPRWSHGDLSADQVLVAADGAVLVIDLDRTCLAPVAADLGSFAAVESLRSQEGAPCADLTPDLLRGYAEAGGEVPAPAVYRAWTAFALATRVTAPLRQARPDWRRDIAGRVAALQELVAP